jgi:hypothetical protein
MKQIAILAGAVISCLAATVKADDFATHEEAAMRFDRAGRAQRIAAGNKQGGPVLAGAGRLTLPEGREGASVSKDPVPPEQKSSDLYVARMLRRDEIAPWVTISGFLTGGGIGAALTAGTTTGAFIGFMAGAVLGGLGSCLVFMLLANFWIDWKRGQVCRSLGGHD